jgi:hypothetical protein
MGLHSWRRFHGANIVARVDPNPFGLWDASVGTTLESSSAPVALKYRLLTSAQAAADHAARTRFNHTCDLGTCGDWLPIS